MEGFEAIATILLGILLRLGIPVALTVLVIWVLRKLDDSWRKEAEDKGLISVSAKNPGCWNIHNCPEKQREKCKAYRNPDQPCWQVFRESGGNLNQKCLDCEVFIHAPIPISN